MNGKQTIFGLALTSMMAVAAACNGDMQESGGSTLRPVSFMTGMHVTRTNSTRDNVWSTTDRIAVSDGVSATVSEYRPASDGVSVPLSPADDANIIYWPIDKADRNFEAWYPYSSTKPTSWSVNDDQRSTAIDESAFNAYDLLYAESGTQSNGSNVTLNFHHQMAHVIVYIRALAWTGQSVTAIKLGNDNLTLTGTVSMGTTGDGGTVSWTGLTGGTSSITMRQSSTFAYECLVPPQVVGNGSSNVLQFETATDQTAYQASEEYQNNTSVPDTKNYHYTDALTLEAGKQYIFNIRLERVGLTVTSTLRDWDTATTTDVEASENPIGTTAGVINNWTYDGLTIINRDQTTFHE